MGRIGARVILPVVLALGLGAAVSVSSALGETLSGARALPQGESATMPAGFAGPARDKGGLLPTTAATGQFTSRNWDGYLTYASNEGTDFKVVKAKWIQPAVTCPADNAWTVFWVGLDGWWNDTVEQGGTSAECVNGTPQYASWWEMYPTNAIQTVFSINAGDTMKASVTYQTSDATYVITVKDITSGQSFTENEQCASNLTCDRSSAEVIAEDVGMFGGDGFFPLADYGTMGFGGSSITDTSGHTGSFSNPHWLRAAITEASGGTTYATVSKLANEGKAFKATWNHP